MEPTNLMSEGLTLMIFGMGFVFVFLTLLVYATGWMSKLVGRYVPEPAPVVRAAPVMATAAPAQDDAQLVAVLAAAVRAHRARH